MLEQALSKNKFNLPVKSFCGKLSSEVVQKWQYHVVKMDTDFALGGDAGCYSYHSCNFLCI